MIMLKHLGQNLTLKFSQNHLFFNRNLSIEDITCGYNDKYHNDLRNQANVKVDFQSKISDNSAHNAASTCEHMKDFIHWMYE